MLIADWLTKIFVSGLEGISSFFFHLSFINSSNRTRTMVRLYENDLSSSEFNAVITTTQTINLRDIIVPEVAAKDAEIAQLKRDLAEANERARHFEFHYLSTKNYSDELFEIGEIQERHIDEKDAELKKLNQEFNSQQRRIEVQACYIGELRQKLKYDIPFEHYQLNTNLKALAIPYPVRSGCTKVMVSNRSNTRFCRKGRKLLLKKQ